MARCSASAERPRLAARAFSAATTRRSRLRTRQLWHRYRIHSTPDSVVRGRCRCAHPRRLDEPWPGHRGCVVARAAGRNRRRRRGHPGRRDRVLATRVPVTDPYPSTLIVVSGSTRLARQAGDRRQPRDTSQSGDAGAQEIRQRIVTRDAVEQRFEETRGGHRGEPQPRHEPRRRSAPRRQARRAVEARAASRRAPGGCRFHATAATRGTTSRRRSRSTASGSRRSRTSSGPP